MNDHDRFTQQMNEAFELLQKVIRELQVPIATRDKLSMYVRHLREAAYQAGRTENKHN